MSTGSRTGYIPKLAQYTDLYIANVYVLFRVYKYFSSKTLFAIELVTATYSPFTTCKMTRTLNIDSICIIYF